MTNEEKAKAYDEAIKRAKHYKEGITDRKLEKDENIMDYIFPELKESEDEKIRKWIITFIEVRLNDAGEFIDNYKNAIAWLKKQGESKENPTHKQVWDYCSKISSEWWQIAMNKWNTLTDEDKNKYNQFIGFNDFSDTLMNITASALFQLIDTGKLEYEEGSLLLEKPDDTPKPLEGTNTINEKQDEQKPTCLLDNSVHKVKFPFSYKAKVKSNGKIVTIIEGQLSMDCKKWIKYQSDVEDGYHVYGPEELVDVEQKTTECTLKDAAAIFLDALSKTPYNNKPITDAQVITRELLKFLSDACSYNPDAINEQKPADKVEPKLFNKNSKK